LRQYYIEYHVEYIMGEVLKMLLKTLKETVRTVKEKEILHSEKLIETTHWLHSLEFLVVRMMMFAIGVHHLYVYTIKTVF
jgi:F420-0:gamma-glutamyl ligase-like protein